MDLIERGANAENVNNITVNIRKACVIMQKNWRRKHGKREAEETDSIKEEEEKKEEELER